MEHIRNNKQNLSPPPPYTFSTSRPSTLSRYGMLSLQWPLVHNACFSLWEKVTRSTSYDFCEVALEKKAIRVAKSYVASASLCPKGYNSCMSEYNQCNNDSLPQGI